MFLDMFWQESDNVIYIFKREGLPNKDLPDLIIFKSNREFWSIGERPDAFNDWLKSYGHANISPERIFTGMSLTFMAQVIYIENGGAWNCMKNRFITSHPAPFSSLEEARLKSAANGWPEPVRIY
jgi:hypothetical protein